MSHDERGRTGGSGAVIRWGGGSERPCRAKRISGCPHSGRLTHLTGLPFLKFCSPRRLLRVDARYIEVHANTPEVVGADTWPYFHIAQ